MTASRAALAVLVLAVLPLQASQTLADPVMLPTRLVPDTPFVNLQPSPHLPAGNNCGSSTLVVNGLASSNGATYDGGTEIRLTLGTGRVLAEQIQIDAPTIETVSYNTAGAVHSVFLDSAVAGQHSVSYLAKTKCVASGGGPQESFSGSYTQFSSGNKCLPSGDDAAGTRLPDLPAHPSLPRAPSPGEPVGAVTKVLNEVLNLHPSQPPLPPLPPAPSPAPPHVAPPPYNVGFFAMPALAVGGNYNGATITSVHAVLKFITVEVPAGSSATFYDQTTHDANARFCHIDSHYDALFSPNDPGYLFQYAPTQIHADQAWDTTLGTSTTLVCVADSGVDATHPDLAGNWLGGHNSFDGTATAPDDFGHGTHVAGIVAATINNNVGVAGLAQVGLKAAKVLSGGGGSASTVSDGIQWCADNGARVINLSLGGPDDPTVHAAVDYAWGSGALLVASTGNDGCAGPGCIKYPAAYPDVLAVGCTDNSSTRCWFSNGGPEIGLAAPGDSILSTCTNTLPLCWDPSYGCVVETLGGSNDYAYCSGTSMAAPQVTGAAALIWSQVPGLSNAQVRTYLECTATDLGAPGHDDLYGDGQLNVKAALDAAMAGNCSSGYVCSGSFLADGTPPTAGSTYGPGVTTVQILHSLGAHPTNFDFTPKTATNGNPVKSEQIGHDLYHVWVAGSGTAHLTVTATLNCPGGPMPISAQWTQIN